MNNKCVNEKHISTQPNDFKAETFLLSLVVVLFCVLDLLAQIEISISDGTHAAIKLIILVINSIVAVRIVASFLRSRRVSK